MPDLKTNYLGLELKNPLIASASPFPRKVNNVVEHGTRRGFSGSNVLSL